MENVSHNTSYDSADNLSRDPNQQPFEEPDFEFEQSQRVQQSSIGLRQNWGMGFQPIINEVIPEYPDLEQSRPSRQRKH